MDQPDLTAADCRQRQRRLLAEMERLGTGLALIARPEHVQWLTGARFGPLFEPAAALDGDGRMVLVVPAKKGQPPPTGPYAADELLGYEAKWHSTLRNDQRQASAEVLRSALPSARLRGTLGVEFSCCGPHLAGSEADALVDLEPALLRLRRRKEADELAMMRRAIDATGAMYRAAREMIAPGINELEVYSRLYAVAVEELREPPTYFGQDFQCNSRGGPPRDRRAEEGELYILDLGAGYRGYFSDNARTFAVGGAPSDAQLSAWEAVRSVFGLVEAEVRPGASCRELFQRVQAQLDASLPWRFNHHLGHGVGLFPHEAPHLNPNWDDQFEEGDVFTAEPGLYHDELRHGLRLEQNYRVTADGVELLTEFSLDL